MKHARKKAFLAAFAQIGSVRHAAEAAGIGRATHYRWMQEDPEYAAAFTEAQEEAADRLEEEARRRAVEGVDEPVFYKGKKCGAIRRYSDSLLIFLLKGVRPEKFKERSSTELSGPQGGDIVVTFVQPGSKPDGSTH